MSGLRSGLFCVAFTQRTYLVNIHCPSWPGTDRDLSVLNFGVLGSGAIPGFHAAAASLSASAGAPSDGRATAKMLHGSARTAHAEQPQSECTVVSRRHKGSHRSNIKTFVGAEHRWRNRSWRIKRAWLDGNLVDLMKATDTGGVKGVGEILEDADFDE